MLYTQVQSLQDVQDILALQAENHKSILSESAKKAQGFVTVRHDLDLLWRMNQDSPSTIARGDNGALAGYCLMMPRPFRKDIPILEPMFERLERLHHQGLSVDTRRWFIMGQVCVAEAFRGMGVFDGMYAHLFEQYRAQYDWVITEISEQNPRSMRAHERVGFEVLHQYVNEATGEKWSMVLRPLNTI